MPMDKNAVMVINSGEEDNLTFKVKHLAHSEDLTLGLNLIVGTQGQRMILQHQTMGFLTESKILMHDG